MHAVLTDYIKKNIMKAVIVMAILLSCFCTAKALKRPSSVANAETNRNLKCVSVCVSENDTLWSIATEYYSDEYNGIPGLVNEIKNINNMSSDRIDAGNYLIIPYYE